MTPEQKQYCKDNYHFYSELKAGAPKHLSDYDKAKLADIAKGINPAISFTLNGCQDCINALVTFVFMQYDKETSIEKKMVITFESPAKKRKGQDN